MSLAIDYYYYPITLQRLRFLIARILSETCLLYIGLFF